RVTAKLATPQGGTIQFDSTQFDSTQFDSTAVKRPMGQGGQLADALQPLVGAEVEITISTRGELLEAKPMNNAAKRILAGSDKGTSSSGSQKLKSGAKPTDDSAVARPSLEQLLRQSFIVFPERQVGPGEEWKSTTPLTTVAGPMEQTTTYRLVETVEQGGER